MLGLQETKVTDDKFPVGEFEDLGYRCAFSGQPTYNGVALISRKPAVSRWCSQWPTSYATSIRLARSNRRY